MGERNARPSAADRRPASRRVTKAPPYAPSMPVIPWHSLEPSSCETFVSIMILRDHPDGTRRRPSQGDHGIDVIVPVDISANVHDIYQIKYFYQTLKRPQRRQIEESAARLRDFVQERELQVRTWHLTLPLDPTDGDEDWIQGLFTGASTRTRWKGLTHLEGWAAKYPDVVDYYINGGSERMMERVDSALRLAGLRRGDGDAGISADSLHASVAALFDQLNHDDPHYRYTFAASHKEPNRNPLPPGLAMRQITQPISAGPFITIDVYPRYREAPVDRPIEGRVRVSVPPSETELFDKWQRFLTFGEPVTVPSKYVQGEMTDPLSGDRRLAGGSITFAPGAFTPKRLRVVVTDDQQHLDVVTMTTQSFSQGLSEGYAAEMRSDAGAIVVHYNYDTETSRVQCRVTLDWQSKVAVKILSDIKFASNLRPGRSLLIAHEFTGPYTSLAEINLDKELVPRWLNAYSEALAILQGYASEPLLLVPPSPTGIEVEEAVKLAQLVRGSTFVKRDGQWLIEVENPHDFASAVAGGGKLDAIATLAFSVGVAGLEIPNVRHVAENVRADVVTVDGRPQLLITSSRDDGGMDLKIHRS
jgi:hypothetical protein